MNHSDVVISFYNLHITFIVICSINFNTLHQTKIIKYNNISFLSKLCKPYGHQSRAARGSQPAPGFDFNIFLNEWLTDDLLNKIVNITRLNVDIFPFAQCKTVAQCLHSFSKSQILMGPSKHPIPPKYTILWASFYAIQNHTSSTKVYLYQIWDTCSVTR